MKTVLILVLAASIVVCAIPAFASTSGLIGIYSDSPGYAGCNLVYKGGEYTYAYIVHKDPVDNEAGSSEWKLLLNWTGPVSVTPTLAAGNVALGDVMTGISVAYGGCKRLPRLLYTLQIGSFFVPGPCQGMFKISYDPASGSHRVLSVTCGSIKEEIWGGLLWVNADGENCGCWPAAEETTWAKVKALYR